MRWRLILSLVVSVVIGGALLALAWSELDLEGIEAFWAKADRGRVGLGLLGYSALFAVVHALRVWRWIYLIRPLGAVRTSTVLRAGLIGFTAIILLPLRLGEMVRPYVLSREAGVPMSAALGTVVVERVVDGLFITGLLFVTLLTYSGGESTAFVEGIGWLSAAVFLSALGVCVLGVWRRAWTLALVERLGGKRLGAKAAGMLGAFLDGVGAMGARGTLWPFLGLTGLYWTVNGLSIAFLGAWGFDLELGLWAGMTILAVLVVGIMIPSGPAMAGNYELFAMRALGLFTGIGVASSVGAAFVAGMHLAQFAVQVAPGLILMWAPVGGQAGYRLLALSEEGSRAAAESAGVDDSSR